MIGTEAVLLAIQVSCIAHACFPPSRRSLARFHIMAALPEVAPRLALMTRLLVSVKLVRIGFRNPLQRDRSTGACRASFIPYLRLHLSVLLWKYG